ncbi:hypothetical protein [Acetobacter senegalensis]|uniref:hypothetical protein n=1 Tax=Acetobacter senegalensis TaxID=446692 RepID=UPI002653CB15|nr:hypothetical protein [Acetobacter senegalensis]MDN7351800.1 hypothetical protein [Acetobacter senegalensis]
MTSPDRLEVRKEWSNSSQRYVNIDSIKNDGSGGGGADMEPRIAVLEYRAESADQRMARMEDKLDRLIEATSKLPSTNAMWTMVASVIGICAASVGVIVAVLTWLQGFHH